MARKKKKESDGPSQAYLISFGDTMTALLAFFIVLNSLAEEQTGAKLYSGTGSFIRSVTTMGMPGMFPSDKSARVSQLVDASPMYMIEDPEGRDREPNATGPDENPNKVRVIDRDAEEFQRYLNEMDRLHSVQNQPAAKARVVFDFFKPLDSESGTLPGEAQPAVAEVLSQLRNDAYRAEVIVWATMPSQSAWERAAVQSSRIRDDIVQRARLDPATAKRLTPAGKPWLFPDEQRPVFSLVVIRTDS